MIFMKMDKLKILAERQTTHEGRGLGLCGKISGQALGTQRLGLVIKITEQVQKDEMTG